MNHRDPQIELPVSLGMFHASFMVAFSMHFRTNVRGTLKNNTTKFWRTFRLASEC
jgi:hypothetical protein